MFALIQAFDIRCFFYQASSVFWLCPNNRSYASLAYNTCGPCARCTVSKQKLNILCTCWFAIDLELCAFAALNPSCNFQLIKIIVLRGGFLVLIIKLQ